MATLPLRVLVVEDEALLAMDLETMIEDCGHSVVAEAASLHDVIALPPELLPDLAFVDVQLAKGTSGIDVCRFIQKQWAETVIVFITANPAKIPPDYAGGHGVIPKPFSRTGMMSALRYLEQGLIDPPPTSPRPASFVAAPNLRKIWH